MPPLTTQAPARSRLPYEPPAYQVDGIFETLALGCHVNPSCGKNDGITDIANKCCHISYS